MYCKITSNLKRRIGQATEYIYGGLDIDNIKASCIDHELDLAVVYYTGSIGVNPNVIEITEDEFNSFCEEARLKEEEVNKTMDFASRFDLVEAMLMETLQAIALLGGGGAE